MSIRLRRVAVPVVVGALVASVLLLMPAPGQASAVTKVSTTTETRCAFLTYQTPTNWYFPPDHPKALVWVQHGFARNNERVDDLARQYAAAGYLAVATTLASADLFGCTLQNLGNNTKYLNNVADLFGKKSRSDKLSRSLEVAKRKAGRPAVAMPTDFFFTGHSAGGEAVTYVANRLRTSYAAEYANFKGLILLDPVPSAAGSNLRTGLAGLSGSRPVFVIAAPSGSCNSSGAGTAAVQQLIRQGFVGVRLTSGAHTDAEGNSTNWLGTAACGTPQAANVRALQTLSVGWANDLVAGSVTPDFYPGGSYLNSLGSSVEVLAGTN